MKQSQKKMSAIDERFTSIADSVTEFVGKWWFTVLSLLLLMAWIIYGILVIPGWFTSAAWNFPANSITTLGEWFMEGLVLAAANRVEKRNKALQEQQLRIVQHIDRTAAREEQEVTAAKRRLLVEDRRMEAIMNHLDKQDAMILQIAQRLDEEQ